MKNLLETWKKYQDDVLTEAVVEPEEFPRAAEKEAAKPAPVPAAKPAATTPAVTPKYVMSGYKAGEEIKLNKGMSDREQRQARRHNRAQGFRSGRIAKGAGTTAPPAAAPPAAKPAAAAPAPVSDVGGGLPQWRDILDRAPGPKATRTDKVRHRKRAAATDATRWSDDDHLGIPGRPESTKTDLTHMAGPGTWEGGASGASGAGEMATARRQRRRRARREGLTISQSKLTELIKEELKEIMDLPSDLSAPASEAELRMDALSSSWEKLITDRILDGETGIWSNTEVVDPIDGERRLLDEFLAILGNYVVSDEIDQGDATDLVKSIANQISDNLFEPSPHEWGIAPPKWEGAPFEELEEGGRAGHYESPEEESDLISALKAAVRAWKPETSEGEQYEEDIENILHRFDTSELQEVRAPFPVHSRVRHEDYGVGTVTHAGTKHTNVAVNFDDAGPKQVSRGSLRRADSPKNRKR